jgi:hypothetical protein
MIVLQPFTTEREWTVDGIPVLSAVVSLPQPGSVSDRLSRRIFRYYQQQCRAYLKYCEQDLFPRARAAYRAALAISAPLPLFRAELTYQITFQDSHFLSLYTQSKESDGEHIWQARRSDTWDLSTGYPVPLSDFFPSRSPWKRQILEQVAEAIQTQEATGTAQYHAHRRQELRRHFNPRNYYLTPEGLMVFFPMYAIAPPFEGIPAFSVSSGEFQLTDLDLT